MYEPKKAVYMHLSKILLIWISKHEPIPIIVNLVDNAARYTTRNGWWSWTLGEDSADWLYLDGVDKWLARL